LKADFETYELKVGYNFSLFSLVSMTSYLDYLNDSDFKSNPAGTRSYVNTKLSANMFTQEFNLASNGGEHWRWTAGAMYRDGKDRQLQDLYLVTYPNSVEYTSESWAVFGELTRVFLGGKLQLTGGLRYFEDTVGQENNSNFGNAPPAPSSLAPDVENKYTATTPRAILNWHPREQLIFYASYSEGFRSGLQQAPAVRLAFPTFPMTKPDRLVNYEIGSKGSFWNDSVSFETAVYYMDWRDVQIPLGVFVNNIGFGALVNGASASGIGTDVALSVRPTERLAFQVSVSWNDLAVDENVYSNNVLLLEKGDRLNGSIETTAAASASYTIPLGDLEGRFTIAANRRTRLSTRAITGGAAVDYRGDPMLTSRADFTIDSTRRWSASIFVENLNNEQGESYVSPSFVAGLTDYYYIRPRTYGLQMEFHL
jgi:outer membrane receptor protein involved in Fe transport